ncbi:MAG: STAS domain-containing protein [Candidatus Schekmanbacteria bacterium]|nr:STAS domain-containing protein [Candidatus Schekmanbacteria bacterium]
MSIGFDIQDLSGVTVLRVAGFVDAHTAPDFERQLVRLIESGRTRVVLDLAGLEYMSSAGLGVFMAVVEDLRGNGGDLRVASLRENVRSVYELLGFHTVFMTFEGVDEAVRSYSGGDGTLQS